jgi:hypothetical protein
MHMLRKISLEICVGTALALMSPMILANRTVVIAQDNSKNQTTEKVKVVAHLSVPGSPVRQIFLQEENGKRYLYLQQNVHFTVVDVTDEDKPQIIDRVASGGKLTDVGAGLAISVQSDQSQGAVPTQTIRLMDMSDPKNPRTARTFNGVTSIYYGDGRHLIYLTNAEGLWIVKHSENHRLPMCTSESEENSVVQCQ